MQRRSLVELATRNLRSTALMAYYHLNHQLCRRASTTSADVGCPPWTWLEMPNKPAVTRFSKPSPDPAVADKSARVFARPRAEA